jgi:hypothetical protein
VQTSITSSDTASSHHHRRDADDFAREIKARKATEQDELSQDNPSSDINVINAAQEAAHRLLTGQAWQDWVAVGRALLVGRTEAMRTANTNKPTGKLYAAQFGQWLTAAKLDKVANKATRSRLLNLLDHRRGRGVARNPGHEQAARTQSPEHGLAALAEGHGGADHGISRQAVVPRREVERELGRLAGRGASAQRG